MNEELDKRIREIANKYVSECWGSYLDLSEVDLISAGIGVALEATKELEEKLEQAEKENAELKERIDNLYNSDCWASEQLTKAKELLKQLVNIEYAVNIPKEKIISLRVKAEQFLKETEK